MIEVDANFGQGYSGMHILYVELHLRYTTQHHHHPIV
jgi:hypothetical protein